MPFPSNMPSGQMQNHADGSTLSLTLQRGQTIDTAELGQHLWQVRHGLLALQGVADNPCACPQLAPAGHWLGYEAMLNLPDRRMVTAIVETTLDAHSFDAFPDKRTLMMAILLQQQGIFQRQLAMRTGPALGRLHELQRLLRDTLPEHGSRRALELLGLRHVAMLIDVAPETACRLQAKLQGRSRGTSRDRRLAA